MRKSRSQWPAAAGRGGLVIRNMDARGTKLRRAWSGALHIRVVVWAGRLCLGVVSVSVGFVGRVSQGGAPLHPRTARLFDSAPLPRNDSAKRATLLRSWPWGGGTQPRRRCSVRLGPMLMGKPMFQLPADRAGTSGVGLRTSIGVEHTEIPTIPAPRRPLVGATIMRRVATRPSGPAPASAAGAAGGRLVARGARRDGLVRCERKGTIWESSRLQRERLASIPRFTRPEVPASPRGAACGDACGPCGPFAVLGGGARRLAVSAIGAPPKGFLLSQVDRTVRWLWPRKRRPTDTPLSNSLGHTQRRPPGPQRAVDQLGAIGSRTHERASESEPLFARQRFSRRPPPAAPMLHPSLFYKRSCLVGFGRR